MSKYSIQSFIYAASLRATMLLLTGCTGMTLDSRHESAEKIANSAAMAPLSIQTGRHTLAAWAKWSDTNAPMIIYIEGDGLAWLSRRDPSLNPTPKNALGLKLASRDASPNIVYLARPCQFTPFDVVTNNCQPADWTNSRFSTEIINEYMVALNMLRQKYGVTAFHLVGYSGGGNIAGLLAAKRTDVLSLRTVAGNVDNDAFITYHNVSPMPASLNMAQYAPQLACLPQIHFVGSNDKIIPQSLAEGYKAKTKQSPTATSGPHCDCIAVTIVKEASHSEGWDDLWPSLSSTPAPCTP